MKEVLLRRKVDVRFPIDGSSISPDLFAGGSLGEIEDLPLLVGNREKRLGDIFEVSGETAEDPSNQAIRVVGGVRNFREIGKGMSGGVIKIEGDGGFNLGEGMEGGTIIVDGDAGSWVGSSMRGGLIEVLGDVENQVGASYRGKGQGMTGGRILIHGSAGYEVGSWMQGGFIHIKGNVGQFAGVHMRGGEILVEGDSEGRLGASMTGGKIVLLGRVPGILPSFSFEEIRKSARIGGERIKERFYFFRGDITEEGSGRLYVSVERNPHLKFYERLLE